MDDINSLEHLLDLQVVDSDLDRLFERRASLPELEAYRTAHAELSAVENQLAEMNARQREIDLASDKADGELKIHEEKAHREEQRLYAGSLSARDAEHLRAEVEMLRRRVSKGEDELLSLMEETEVLEAVRANQEAEREAIGAEKDRIEEVVSASWKEIDADVARLEAKKADIVPLIDPNLVELYEEIRSAKEGVAIARLGEGVCGGCHLTLSAAEQVQAAKSFPPRCIHCRRMLLLP